MCMQVSRLYLVDMPGAERLLVDPEVVRQREGSQVNHSLLSFATTLRKLAQGNQPHTINHSASILTKLLAGALLLALLLLALLLLALLLLALLPVLHYGMALSRTAMAAATAVATDFVNQEDCARSVSKSQLAMQM